MSFDIVWVPLTSVMTAGAALDPTGALLFPHLVDTPGRSQPDDGYRTRIGPRTLVLGILMTSAEGCHLTGHAPTAEQLREVLLRVAEDLGADSVDELCATAMAHLERNHGESAGLTARRRGVELLPDSLFTRGDLVVALVLRATSGEPRALDQLDEAAREFLIWVDKPTWACANEAIVYYSGLAALTALGRVVERDGVLVSHNEAIERSQWLRAQVSALRSYSAGVSGDLTALAAPLYEVQ